MAKYWIDYSASFNPSPLSFWVHRPKDAEIWSQADEYEPAFPSKVFGNGFPEFKIEHKGYILVFSSLYEIEHCISVLSHKVLPTTNELSKKSWMNEGYQHLHWLSKWPSKIKNYKDRIAIIKLLEKLKCLNS
jgi:hypothetical protein